MSGRYEHVIWDWNGTLLDDAGLCVTILNEMLSRRGLPETTMDEYRAAFTFPVQAYYEHVGFDSARHSFVTLGNEFFSAYEKGKHACTLQPAARATLERIGSDLSQSLLSAYSHDALVASVDGFGLRHLFTHLVGLDHIYASGKTEVGKGLISRLPCAPKRIVLIGDTLHDAEVATVLGTGCILVTHGHQSRDRLRAGGVPLVDSLDQLHAYL